MNFVDIMGWVPAIVFPSASLIQLVHLMRKKSAEGASAIAWGAFCLGNLSTYIYMQKYGEIQSLIGFLGSAVIQFAIVLFIIRFRKERIMQRA